MTEHQSLDGGPHPDEWVAGPSCVPCEEWIADKRVAVWNPPPLIGTVPGGANDTPEHRWHMQGFDREMTKYKGAVDNGLSPSAITEQAVEAAERGYDHVDQMKMDDRLGDRKDEKRNARAKQQLADEGIVV